MMLTLRGYTSFEGLKQEIDSQLTFLKETTGLAHKPLLATLEEQQRDTQGAQPEFGEEAELDEDTMTQVLAVLTPEQQEEFPSLSLAEQLEILAFTKTRLGKRTGGAKGKGKGKGRPATRPPTPPRTSAAPAYAQAKCGNGGGTHETRECSKPRIDPKDRPCHKCGQKGHMWRQCPSNLVAVVSHGRDRAAAPTAGPRVLCMTTADDHAPSLHESLKLAQTVGSKPVKSWTRPITGEETTSYTNPEASDNSFTLGDFKLVPSRNSRRSQKSLKVSCVRDELKEPIVLRNLFWPLNEEEDAPNHSSLANNDHVLSHNVPNISVVDKYGKYEASGEEVKMLKKESISEFIFSGPPQAHFALQGEWSELPPVHGDSCVKQGVDLSIPDSAYGSDQQCLLNTANDGPTTSDEQRSDVKDKASCSSCECKSGHRATLRRSSCECKSGHRATLRRSMSLEGMPDHRVTLPRRPCGDGLSGHLTTRPHHESNTDASGTNPEPIDMGVCDCDAQAAGDRKTSDSAAAPSSCKSVHKIDEAQAAGDRKTSDPAAAPFSCKSVHMINEAADNDGIVDDETYELVDSNTDDDLEHGLVESEDEEDTPHIPSEKLTTHQRIRREHREAMERSQEKLTALARNGLLSPVPSPSPSCRRPRSRPRPRRTPSGRRRRCRACACPPQSRPWPTAAGGAREERGAGGLPASVERGPWRR